MSSLAQDNSIFEIDRELDILLDEIQEQTESAETEEIPQELMQRFQQFCDAYSEKVDRIGKFLSLMEARVLYCRAQATRLTERALWAENKVNHTKNMVLYFLRSRDLRKVEGREFTLRLQKNSQDSVVILDEPQVPVFYRDIEVKIPGSLWQALLSFLPDEAGRELKTCVQQMKPSSNAIKAAVASSEEVPGAVVRRGTHLRVA